MSRGKEERDAATRQVFSAVPRVEVLESTFEVGQILCFPVAGRPERPTRSTLPGAEH